jgi:ribonuclease HI
VGTTKVGGWAYTLQQADGSSKAEDSGAVRGTTNNRMELFAVIMGLESLAEPARVEIVTDSVYIRKGIADWLPKWRSQGWRAGSERRPRPLANVDLWRRLDTQLGRHEVSVRWVPAHSGHIENEYCDWLARRAARRLAGPRRSMCVA